MKAMKIWMETKGVKYSPNSQIVKAITYAYTLWDNTIKYLNNGCPLGDNNPTKKILYVQSLGAVRTIFSVATMKRWSTYRFKLRKILPLSIVMLISNFLFVI